MVSVTEKYLEGILSDQKSTEHDIETDLLDLAQRALRRLCTPEMLASRRLVIAEAEYSGIGRLFYEKIISYQQEVASFLARAMEEGKLRKVDPMLVTMQFRALFEAESFEPCILGMLQVPLSDDAVLRTAGNAVTMFMPAYAPLPGGAEDSGACQIVVGQ